MDEKEIEIVKIDRLKVTREIIATVFLKRDIADKIVPSSTNLKNKNTKLQYMNEARAWLHLPTEEWDQWMVKAVHKELGLFA